MKRGNFSYASAMLPFYARLAALREAKERIDREIAALARIIELLEGEYGR